MNPITTKKAIDITDFLLAAFDPESLPETERICIGVGEGGTKSVSGTANNIRKLDVGKTELYICLSTVVSPDTSNGRLRRRAEDVRTAYMLVLDDIGTKSAAPTIEPSYKLQTSIKDGKANYQWGYFITPFDVSTPENRAYFDACLVAAAMAGINDPGLRSASRIVRLPGALHKSGFIAEIADWNPDRVWDLPELMSQLELNPDASVRPLTVLRADALDHLADIQDPVLDWLQSQGLVHSAGTGDFLEVVCPWADAHTDGSDLAGYSPLDYRAKGRQFHCMHGHCQDKHTGEFLAWVEAEGGPKTVLGELTEAQLEAFRGVLAGLGDVGWSTLGFGASGAVGAVGAFVDTTVAEKLERFVFSSLQQTWIDTEDGRYANTLTLRARLQAHMPMNNRGKRRVPEEAWFENPGRTCVVDKIWFPGAPQGVVEYSGENYWNTYVPYEPPCRFDPEISRLFHEHILDTFGEEGIHLEQWLGWAAQHPEQKIIWAPLLCGVPGDGKSMLADALGLAVGASRLHKSSTTAISGNFNAFLEGKLVLAIEELRVSGQNRHSILDKLKDIVTNLSIEIRPKGLDNRTAPNFCNVIAMTNHKDALPVDNSDRRWAIFTSRFINNNGNLKQERIDTGYFDVMMDAIRNDPGVVVGWLRSIDVAEFNPYARAPLTLAKIDMIDDAANEGELMVRDIIAGAGGYGITPDALVLASLRAQLRKRSLDDEPNRLSPVLRNAGFTRGKNGVRIDGDFVRIWYRPERYGHKVSAAIQAAKADLEAHNAAYVEGVSQPTMHPTLRIVT